MCCRLCAVSRVGLLYTRAGSVTLEDYSTGRDIPFCFLLVFLFIGMEMGTEEKGSGFDIMIPRSIKRKTANGPGRTGSFFLFFLFLRFISFF